MDIRELIEQLEEIDSVGLTSLTMEQRQRLKDTYNAYVSFDYGKDEDGNYIIVTSNDSYNTLNHYMGFEYISDDDIHLQVETHGFVVLKVDQYNDRMANLFVLLNFEDVEESEE